MIYEVKIDSRTFEVEVKDIYARPVIAIVDGVEFEVWPQVKKNEKAVATIKPVSDVHENRPAGQIAVPVKSGGSGNGSSHLYNNTNPREVRAPIPGVIISISVQPGSQVSVGEELCVLEAMKMKNAIRAGRSGTIAVINAQVGQHVKHRDILMEFED